MMTMDDDNDTRQSPDDALEAPDDIFNPDVDEETLVEDNDSPAAPADDAVGHRIPIDDPRTDSGLDEDELYDSGLAEAAGADDSEIGPDEEPQPLEPDDES